MTPDRFIGRWAEAKLNEAAGAKPHFLDLCELLDVPKPHEDNQGTTYAFEKMAAERYSPGVCTGAVQRRVEGRPDPDHISTSYAERANLTLRMGSRRFTRLTNAFSKKVENHAYSVAIHTMHYNFVRIHQTLRCTPAMAAGVTQTLWDLADMVRVLEVWEGAQAG